MGEVIFMKMKKIISANKLCTCMALSAMGAAMGMVIAKVIITNCCCGEKLKCKAKKAFKTMEEKILP